MSKLREILEELVYDIDDTYNVFNPENREIILERSLNKIYALLPGEEDKYNEAKRIMNEPLGRISEIQAGMQYIIKHIKQ